MANLLWVHKDPGNLVLVINSNDNEEKYFTEKLQLTPVPTLGNERLVIVMTMHCNASEQINFSLCYQRK